MKHYSDGDIAIVGVGCVLPGANNIEEFWDILIEGDSLIEDISKTYKNEEDGSLYFSKDKNAPDKVYSFAGARVVDDELKKICEKLKLDWRNNTRLQIMALEATTQSLKNVNNLSKNTGIFLGNMEVDGKETSAFYVSEYDEIKKITKKKYEEHVDDVLEIFDERYKQSDIYDKDNTLDFVPSRYSATVIDLIIKKYGFTNEGFLIDAACASSLAAIDIAINKLRNKEIDVAISGGIESTLAVSTFIMFSKVGAMCTRGTFPFDHKTDGLSQGEGSVIFTLKRIEDAIRDKDEIHGVIKSIGASSDGSKGSLFSPTVEGQIKAYERTYNNISNDIDYLEAHGTGTTVGDTSEINSINQYFNKEIPIGSVKYIIGHTKSTAGSASLLKCLLMMKQKIVPPSKYFRKPLVKGGKAFINREPLEFNRGEEPLRMGVSSFGFGGINYHLIVEEYTNNSQILIQDKTKEQEIVVIGECDKLSLDEIDYDLLKTTLRVAPNSIPQIDKVQLQSLVAVHKAFENADISMNFLDKDKVSVIATSIIGLDGTVDMAYRLVYYFLEYKLKPLNKDLAKEIFDLKDKYPDITEDTGPGVGNNLIAGRICNKFDFKGKNFNIDSEYNSIPAALKVAIENLQKEEGIIVMTNTQEEENIKNPRIVERKAVSCTILTTKEYATKQGLPIKYKIDGVNYKND